MPALLALAFALAPQAPVAAPPGSLGQSVGRYAPPTATGSYPQHLNGGRTQQLGLLHSGGLETFGLFRPGALPPGTPAARPLLVLFHSFMGDGDGELEAFTRFADEADDRHWYVLAPDQDVPALGFLPTTGQTARRCTYGDDAAQQRLQLTLDWVLANYPIDRTRVYGVGFSMGGGDALSFAAQHLDPARGAFAAVAVNAGTLCLSEEYWRTLDPLRARPALRVAVVGGLAPSASSRFDYERCSTLRYTNRLGASTLDLSVRHPAQNLASIGVQEWIDPADPSPQLHDFADDLELLLGPSVAGSRFERHDRAGPLGSAHQWGTFDFTAVCDALAARQLAVPRTAALLAARDARYWDVTLQRISQGAFGELRFDFTGIGPPALIDRARIVGCRNVGRVHFDGVVQGLGATDAPYEVVLQGNPTRAVRLDIEHVPQPMRVLRNGVDVTSSQGLVWAYDGPSATLTLLSGSAGSSEVWRLQ